MNHNIKSPKYNFDNVQEALSQHNPNGLGGQFPHLDAKEPYVWIQTSGELETGERLRNELGGVKFKFNDGWFSFSIPVNR